MLCGSVYSVQSVVCVQQLTQSKEEGVASILAASITWVQLQPGPTPRRTEPPLYQPPLCTAIRAPSTDEDVFVSRKKAHSINTQMFLIQI